MKIKLHNHGFEMSKIVTGFWRVTNWGYSDSDILDFIEYSINLGVTSFDHADIYGCYSAQEYFGRALKMNPSLRDEMELVSKCGILNNCNNPNQKVNYYDTSEHRIIQSAEHTLKQLETDYLDLLLIHRPDPIMDPEEIASAFRKLKDSGKVKYFGVSNFTPSQFTMLNSYTDDPLVTNQIEFSPLFSTPMYDGTFDSALTNKIKPMIWSPLAGGRLFNPSTRQENDVYHKLDELAKTKDTGIDQIAFAWITKHPSNPVIVTGTGKKERLKAAVDSLKIKLSREEWFDILKACNQCDVP